MVRQVFSVSVSSVSRRVAKPRNILISRLEKHAAISTPTVVSNPTISQQPDDTRSSLLSEDQLAQIQTISTRSVEELVAEIAGNEARATVEPCPTRHLNEI